MSLRSLKIRKWNVEDPLLGKWEYGGLNKVDQRSAGRVDVTEAGDLHPPLFLPPEDAHSR
jgi:hypothetical protein